MQRMAKRYKVLRLCTDLDSTVDIWEKIKARFAQQLKENQPDKLTIGLDEIRQVVVTLENESVHILFGSVGVKNENYNIVVLTDQNGTVRTAPLDEIPEDFYTV